MNHKTYQPKMPDLMEAVFDAAYLIFDLIAGILFFTMAQGRSLFILYGILTPSIWYPGSSGPCEAAATGSKSSSASGCRSLPSP